MLPEAPQPRTITVRALRRAGADGVMVAVELSDGDRLVVHERRVQALGLAAGTQAGPEVLEELHRAAAIDAAERRLLRLIGRRARSRAELVRRLDALDVDARGCDEILARFERLGLVDDAALADDVGERLREAGRGRLSVGQTLRRLEVDPEAAAAALARADDADEAERARLVLRRRYGEGPVDGADTARTAAYLARRGFEPEVVATVLGFDLD